MPKPLTDQTLIGEVLHTWTIQECEKHDRNMVWYVVMLGLGFALVVYGIVAGNFLFSLIIILGAIILFLQAHQEPLQVPFAITELGVVVGSRFYPYSELDSFYIIYEPPHVKTLYFQTTSSLRPLIRVPLLDMNPVEVRHTLLENVDEDMEKEEEPWSDRFAREWRIH